MHRPIFLTRTQRLRATFGRAVVRIAFYATFALIGALMALGF